MGARGPGELETYQTVDGSEIAVIGASWHFNAKITFDGLATEFEKNPTLAWRNYGSVVTQNFDAVWRDPAVVGLRATAREHPWDYAKNEYRPWFRGQRGVYYFLHIDLSKNRDRTGLALVHKDPLTGLLIVDFMIGVEAQGGKDINYGQLRKDYVYPLLDRGFRIQLVTFDGFQSTESRQVLEERSIATDYCSVDRQRGPYDTLIEATMTAKVDYYTYPIFLKEFEELRLINGQRYDHPRRFRDGTRGTKDVADAVAAAAFMCIEHAREHPYSAVHLSVHQPKPARYEHGAF